MTAISTTFHLTGPAGSRLPAWRSRETGRAIARCAPAGFSRAAAAIAAAGSLFCGCGPRAASPPATAVVTNGPLNVWVSYAGRLESRQVHTLLSRLGGQATLVEMVPEGSRVRKGDVLARLDPTRIEREIVRLEAAAASARSEYDSLRYAEWPLKLGDLERQLTEARAREAEERQFLSDSLELLRDDLVTAQEIRQQEAKVSQAETQARQIDDRIRLSREYLQPLGLEQARANWAAAERELDLARQEFEACTLVAPADGVVGYVPAHFGGEYRTARVGDAVFMNQPFMIIPDMSRLAVHCHVPEAELGRIVPGAPARIVPVAFPDLALNGRVESVGATAQVVADKPAWQKYFHVLLAVELADERLRSGLSVTAHLLAYERESALLLPRAAVRWRDGEPTVRVGRDGAAETRAVTLGRADDRQFEVLAGLEAGETVWMED